MNLVPDGSSPLFNDPVFEPGTTVVITTTGPFPAIDGPDVPPFAIEVYLSVDGLSVDGIEAPTPEEIAPYQTLTAYVGGMECGSGSLTEYEGWPYIPVGATGTPDVCREQGAEIVLVNGHGNRLVVRPSMGPGPFYILRNLALEPPHSGSVPQPAVAGQEPAGPSAGATPGAVFFLVALVVVASARGITRRMPNG